MSRSAIWYRIKQGHLRPDENGLLDVTRARRALKRRRSRIFVPYDEKELLEIEKLNEWGYPIHPEMNFLKAEGDFETRIALVIAFSTILIVSWFTRNTKNWHIVYNWLPYSKPIERDALCPDVHVADFQTFKKRKQSWLTSRMESQYPRYVRTWEYIQINTTTGRNRPFPVYLMFFPETLFGRSAVINAKLIT